MPTSGMVILIFPKMFCHNFRISDPAESKIIKLEEPVKMEEPVLEPKEEPKEEVMEVEEPAPEAKAPEPVAEPTPAPGENST